MLCYHSPLIYQCLLCLDWTLTRGYSLSLSLWCSRLQLDPLVTFSLSLISQLKRRFRSKVDIFFLCLLLMQNAMAFCCHYQSHLGLLQTEQVLEEFCLSRLVNWRLHSVTAFDLYGLSCEQGQCAVDRESLSIQEPPRLNPYNMRSALMSVHWNLARTGQLWIQAAFWLSLSCHQDMPSGVVFATVCLSNQRGNLY
jgi:hypothetical protein